MMDDVRELTRCYPAEERKRIADQRRRLEFLKLCGRNSQEAEKTLELFQHSQEIFERILRTVEEEVSI